MNKCAVLFFALFSLIISNQAQGQSDSNEVLIQLKLDYDEFDRIQFSNPEYKYAWTDFEYSIKKLDSQKQMIINITKAGTYKAISSYYDEDFDDVFMSEEQFKIKKEDLPKIIVLQFK